MVETKIYLVYTKVNKLVKHWTSHCARKDFQKRIARVTEDLNKLRCTMRSVTEEMSQNRAILKVFIKTATFIQAVSDIVGTQPKDHSQGHLMSAAGIMSTEFNPEMTAVNFGNPACCCCFSSLSGPLESPWFWGWMVLLRSNLGVMVRQEAGRCLGIKPTLKKSSFRISFAKGLESLWGKSNQKSATVCI